jgi:hypothetical protein
MLIVQPNAKRESRTTETRAGRTYADHDRRRSMWELLDQFRHDWEALAWFRSRRREMRDLRKGKHWQGQMEDPDNPGSYITEEEYILRQGRTPHKMNHASPAIRNLIGQYLQNKSERAAYAVDRDDNEAAEMMTIALRAARRANRSRDLEPDQLEEHLISGMNAWKVTVDYRDDLERDEVCIDRVDTNRLMWNQDVEDRRLKGLRRIGEIHEVTLDEIVSKFADSKRREEEIREMYAGQDTPYLQERGPVGFSARDGIDFYNPSDQAKCRLFELWCVKYIWVIDALDPETGFSGRTEMTRAEIGEENSYRRSMGIPEIEFEEKKEPAWHYYFVTPNGDILEEGETPYWHKGHPYTLGFAAYLDGEWWGLLEDIADPQKLINRLTVQVDHMLAAAAKGVMIVDEQVVEDSKVSLEEIADQWTRFNGVVALKLKPGVPIDGQIRQITANAIPAGLFEWIGMQKAWVEELGGVTGTVQGHNVKSGTPATLYMQQTQQAALTTSVFFHTFFSTLHTLDKKIVQCILQYYDEPMTIATSDGAPAVTFDPERVRDLDWDIAIADTHDTATFRMLFEESLTNFLQAGHISFRQFLEVSSHPRAQQLLHLIDRTNPLMGAPSALDGADPEMALALYQAAQAGDMEARSLIMQAQDAPMPGTEQPTMQPQQMRAPAGGRFANMKPIGIPGLGPTQPHEGLSHGY